MAMVLSTSQKLTGAIVASLLLLCGILGLVGGVMGWFSSGNGDNNSKMSEEFSAGQKMRLEKDKMHSADSQRLSNEYNHHESRSKAFGLKGEKGEQGPRGPPGMTIRGPVGPPGPPGLSIGDINDSYNGICSCNQTMIRQYLRDIKPILLPGPPGQPGPPGPFAVGERGPMGLKGDKGDRGERGDPGPEGLIGPKGEPGRDGLPGLPGPAGPPGPGVFTAPYKYDDAWDKSIFRSEAEKFSPNYLPNIVTQMSKGEQGAPGPVGPPGLRGDPGPKGERGYPGIHGQKGEQGYPGATGPPGSSGDQGVDGNDGVPGHPGQPGRDGQKGEKGERGLPGPPFASTTSMTIKGEKGDVGPPGPSPDCSNYGNDQCRNAPNVVGKLSDLSTLDVSEGTLIYVQSEDMLVVKRAKAWTNIQLGHSVLAGGSIQAPKNLLELDNDVRSSHVERKQLLPPSQSSPQLNTDGKITVIRLAALNTPRSGNLNGVQGVDFQCYRHAKQANIGGTFRAFLAPSLSSNSMSMKEQSSGINLESIVRFSDVPVVNLKGELLFPTWKSMFETGVTMKKDAALYTFDNVDVMSSPLWRSKEVWHGVNMWGESSHQNCDSWSTDNSLQMGLAGDLRQGILIHQKKVSCSRPLMVLCVETGTHTLYSD